MIATSLFVIATAWAAQFGEAYECTEGAEAQRHCYTDCLWWWDNCCELDIWDPLRPQCNDFLLCPEVDEGCLDGYCYSQQELGCVDPQRRPDNCCCGTLHQAIITDQCDTEDCEHCDTDMTCKTRFPDTDQDGNPFDDCWKCVQHYDQAGNFTHSTFETYCDWENCEQCEQGGCYGCLGDFECIFAWPDGYVCVDPDDIT